MSALDDIAPGNAASFGRLHASTFRDAMVARCCTELWRQTNASNGVADKLSTDSLLFAMISALARGAHGRLREAGPALSGRPLAHVLDTIDDRIADDLSLAELAAVADLSPMHFARLFRRAVGVSPHQYVLQRRMARAQALLGLTQHRLADIALAVGFSSQSHMTAVFTKGLGVSPLRYREQRRT
jgi:AraC family transcriptional regulator